MPQGKVGPRKAASGSQELWKRTASSHDWSHWQWHASGGWKSQYPWAGSWKEHAEGWGAAAGWSEYGSAQWEQQDAEGDARHGREMRWQGRPEEKAHYHEDAACDDEEIGAVEALHESSESQNALVQNSKLLMEYISQCCHDSYVYSLFKYEAHGDLFHIDRDDSKGYQAFVRLFGTCVPQERITSDWQPTEEGARSQAAQRAIESLNELKLIRNFAISPSGKRPQISMTRSNPYLGCPSTCCMLLI